MRIEYLHASRFGNGRLVAAESRRQMAAKGADVDVHHIREVKPSALPSADLYLFSSPGRFGRSISSVRKFLKKVTLPSGTLYAVLTTEMAPRPDKKTGRLPTEEELALALPSRRKRAAIGPVPSIAQQAIELEQAA